MEQVSRKTTIKLNGTPDETLPLFTPVGETWWVQGWYPEYVYPADGEAATGTVWKTQNHGAEVVWVTVNYDKVERTATYINVMPDRQVTRIDIQCDGADCDKTSAQVQYTVTALSEEGRDFIEKFTDDHYEAWMQSWEKAINHYLQTGEMLTH